MSQIRIALRLEGRSGILAALIARLNRQDLAFKSHKINDLPGGAGREIEVEADGEIADPDHLIGDLKSVRGVHDVSDLFVDGASILKVPEPESVVEAETGDIPVEAETMNAESLRALSPQPASEPAPAAEPEPAPVRSAEVVPMPTRPQPASPEIDDESNEVRMRRRRRRR